MKRVEKLLKGIVQVERYICCGLLMIMLAVCFLSVIMRYVFNSPLVWSEEVILSALIWFGFLCISIGVKNDEHIAIEGVYNKLPLKAQKCCDVFRHVLLLAFSVFMMTEGYKIFQINLLKNLPATGWNQGIQYFPMVVGGALMTVFSLCNLIAVFLPRDKEEQA